MSEYLSGPASQVEEDDAVYMQGYYDCEGGKPCQVDDPRYTEGFAAAARTEYQQFTKECQFDEF